MRDVFAFFLWILYAKGNDRGYFWQMTDMHLDLLYDPVNGDPSNRCHSPENPKQNSRLNKYGNFKCDAPWDLISKTVSGMKKIHPHPDFILWNGDSSAHFSSSQPPPSMAYVTEVERKIVQSVVNYFPTTEVIPLLGNHDSSPPDYFPDTRITNTTFYRDYFIHSNWSAFITDTNEQVQFNKCGFYKRLSHKKVFLLLNTNLYYQNNNTGQDPCGQLEWFDKEMSAAEPNTVIVASHVPPGYFERLNFGPFMMTKDGDVHYNEYFVDIITKHSDKIFAQFYGHTHTDSFRLFLRGSGGVPVVNVSSIAFIAPSITPSVNWITGTFPSVRLYEYDENRVYNYRQFYLNITESDPQWKEAYDFRETYKTVDMSSKSILDLFNKLSSQPELFSRYYDLNTVLHKQEPCEKKCILTHLCGLSQVRVKGMKSCISNGPNVFPILRGKPYESEGGKEIETLIRVSSLETIVIYVVILAPLFGFVFAFAYLIQKRKGVRKGRGYQTVPLADDF